MRAKLLIAFTSLLLAGNTLFADVTFTPGPDGIKISGAPIGPYTLTYPMSVNEGQPGALKPQVQIHPDGLGVDIAYSNNFNVKVLISREDGTITYTLGDIPGHATYLNFEMDVPLESVAGGQLVIDGKAKSLPLAAGEKMVFTGVGQEMDLFNASGSGLSFKAIPNFMILQDNRVFGGNYFVYYYNYNILADPNRHKFTFSINEAKKKP